MIGKKILSLPLLNARQIQTCAHSEETSLEPRDTAELGQVRPSVTELPAKLEKSDLPESLSEIFEIADLKSGKFRCSNLDALRQRAQRLQEQGTTIIAVRHAESAANEAGHTLSGQGETPLTRKGLEQANDTATNIAGQLGLDEKQLLIYSSPLSRAFDSAKPLHDKFPKSDLVVDPDLAEINFGLCEGREVKEVVKTYPGFASGTDFVHRFPDGESGFDVLERVDRFLSRVEKEGQGKTVVFYGHTMTVGIAKLLLGQVETKDDGSIFVDRRIPNAVPQTLVDASNETEMGLLL